MKIFKYLLLMFIPFSTLAQTELEISKVKLSEAISLIYSEVLKTPYMVAPELVVDERLVSFRIMPQVNERDFITRYFENMNIKIYTKNGIDYITPFTPKEYQAPKRMFVYNPRFRTVGYLTDILSGYVSGSFNNDGGINSGSVAGTSQGSTQNINRAGDSLVFFGTQKEIDLVSSILPSIDTASEEVVVAGYVYEVETSNSDGSGFLLAAKILSDKFKISIGSNTSSPDNIISLKTGSIDAIFNILKTDSRFSVVSAPRLRVKNNSAASFSVGSDVPVLGGVTVSGDTTTQSVEYRSSGVIFKVTPSIKVESIDLTISQQLSNFVQTETGVNNSPTLIKRDVATDVSMRDGDVILIGGLAEHKDSNAKSGWSLFGSKTSELKKTDIVVMLQVTKVRR